MMKDLYGSHVTENTFTDQLKQRITELEGNIIQLRAEITKAQFRETMLTDGLRVARDDIAIVCAERNEMASRLASTLERVKAKFGNDWETKKTLADYQHDVDVAVKALAKLSIGGTGSTGPKTG